jgi:hypothetical protein
VTRATEPARWRRKACNKVKGKAALVLSCVLGTSYVTMFLLAHKPREAMASERNGMRVGGEGKTVETDGGCFGGWVKPVNPKENRVDRRLVKNRNGKRQVSRGYRTDWRSF